MNSPKKQAIFNIINKLVLSLIGITLSHLSVAQLKTDTALIYCININKEINHTSQIYLSRGLNEAQQAGADVILLHLNTYGGLLEAADSMRTDILYSSIPVHVFINNNAASAGALISLACEQIYMRKGANIGAATVVGQTGDAMPDKYQSYMRSLMRSTAEAHGKVPVINGQDTIYRWKRDPQIAEAMVDDRVIIPNLIDSGKTLTLTAEEAIKWGFCDGLANSVDEVITHHLGYKEYKMVSYTPSWTAGLKGFLMNPFLQSILILIIIGGIYFELQTPGVGFPLVAAIIAGILYFSPLYIEGLAENWEILLFVLGLILIMLEVFVIPGFGIAGISGTVLVVTAFFLSLLSNVNFSFDGVSSNDTGRATLTVLAGFVLGSVAVVWLSSRIGSKGMFRHVALVADLENTTSSPVLTGLIGKEGIAKTALRPSGKVAIDGELYDSISEAGFIEKETAVRVVRFENAQIYVEAIG